MKKFIAVLLAMLLVLVNVAALAGSIPEVPDTGKIPNATRDAAPEYSIPKTYTTTGTATDVYPAETLRFTVTPADSSYPTVTVGDNDTFAVDGTTDSYTIPVTVPAASEYGAAGRYHYEVTELAPSDPSQGVTYTEKKFNVDVYVYWDKPEGATELTLVRKAIIYSGTDTEGENANDAAKEDVLDNAYSVGELTVTKKIAGNLADPEKSFTIVIKLTSDKTVASALEVETDGSYEGSLAKGAKEYVFTATLIGSQVIAISNIPTGVGYEVEEVGIHEIGMSAQMDKVNDPLAYTVEYDAEEGTIGSETIDATVTNTKEIKIPTGISVDFVPYLVIIALAGITLVALRVRRREEA